jgi:hypothetical protein
MKPLLAMTDKMPSLRGAAFRDEAISSRKPIEAAVFAGAVGTALQISCRSRSIVSHAVPPVQEKRAPRAWSRRTNSVGARRSVML